MKANRLFLAIALGSWWLSGPAPAECIERVIEWVKEPGRTTKSIRVDGVEVYRNVWQTDASGVSRESGPGWLGTEPAAPPPATRPVQPTPPPATRAPPAPSRPPAPPPATTPSRPVRVDASRARELALSLEGVPYRTGGTDPRHGLHAAAVAYAFFQKMGIESSQEMLGLYRSGEFVSKTSIRPGDMVFHASAGASASVPDMVGIATSATEMVYMSGSQKKVLLVGFDSPYWVSRYKGARRLLGTAEAVPAGSSPWVDPSQRRFEGVASYYGCGDGFDGSGTASGERFDASKLTAAHKTLPLGTWVKVTNKANGKSAKVRVNDRGPYVAGRVLDLSCRAAELIGMLGAGLAQVRAEVVY